VGYGGVSARWEQATGVRAFVDSPGWYPSDRPSGRLGSVGPWYDAMVLGCKSPGGDTGSTSVCVEREESAPLLPKSLPSG